MESKKSTSSAIERFATLGTTEIRAEVGEDTMNVLNVFTKYPDRFYTQKDFVQELGKSNPWINKILNRLVTSNIVTRTKGVSNKFHYQLAPKAPKE